jgi:hypothetical protein
MPEVFHQAKRKSAHLISEMHGVSVDSVLLSGGNFVSAEVLGKSADGTKFIKLSLDAEAAEGKDAVGVLYGDVDASAADANGLAHTRVCAVSADRLVWPADITEQQKAAFIDQLVAATIIPR